MEILQEKSRQTAGNESTGLLKLIALFFMFCDHAGKMLLPGEPGMRVLGRLAFPLYAWCMVVGFCYTRSVPRYLLRIFVIGLISQPLYMLALSHPWDDPNIMLTLLVGLAALWALRARWYGSEFWGPPLAVVAAILLKTGTSSYGWKGVLLMMLLYAARDSRPAIGAVMTAFCLYWGSTSSPVVRFFGLDLSFLSQRRPWQTLMQPWMKLQGLAVLSTPLMLVHLPWEVHLPRWLGYAIYPLHLILLMLLELFLRPDLPWVQSVTSFFSGLF